MTYLYCNKMVRIENTANELYLSISDEFRSEIDKAVFNIDEAVQHFIEMCAGNQDENLISKKLKNEFDIDDRDFAKIKSFFVDIGLLNESDTPVENRVPVYKYDKPFEIVFDITSQCNCKCLYCLNNSGHRAPDELSSQQIAEIVEDIIEIRPNLVSIGGGEPLMRNHDVLYMVKKLTQHEIHNVLFTNATLVTDEIAKSLKEAGLKGIRTSIDGHEAWLHDKLRNTPGCFDKTLRGIRILKDNGITVCISSTISALNFEHMAEIKQFISELGDHANLYPINPLGRGFSEPYLLSEDQYVRMLETIYSNGDGKIDFVSFPKKRCALGELAFIAPNGNIYPCWTLAHNEFIIGHAGNNGLLNLYNESDVLKSCLELNVNKIKKCKSCDIKYLCGGGCRGNSYALANTLYQNDKSRCASIKRFSKIIRTNGTPAAIDRLSEVCING